MIRHTLPDNHNHTTQRFPRHARETPIARWNPFDPIDSIVIGVCLIGLVVVITLIALGY